ncbi:MYXO-CTERM sorting domain-containing protein [Streptomyces sp. NPDC047974]|uniref:MYXO-CTERM sorting domain-containing protein n=1 Tax=Streptomyces sp. NPDC047974 TaxID=3154343 RepID=UPI0033FAF469
MFNVSTALDLLTQGLLTELPSSLITAAVVAAVAWALRRRRKRNHPEGGQDGD